MKVRSETVLVTALVLASVNTAYLSWRFLALHAGLVTPGSGFRLVSGLRGLTIPSEAMTRSRDDAFAESTERMRVIAAAGFVFAGLLGLVAVIGAFGGFDLFPQVLFLSGQYLYDSEAISDDSETNRPRAFPCSEFTLRRHKTESYVAEIRCRGSVLEPEVMAPAFKMKNDWREVGIPEDGDVFVRHDVRWS